ncbi:hypothetical protein [Teichococcus rhizosphaerae]|uniref:hypothetical protein n=1 Tax=Teichococcus rhizosphaerae TaxID=1335062 RepID=UPI001145B23A|nr:hypothetical protein [Pseudoroseomonas rhizosphaerae]
MEASDRVKMLAKTEGWSSGREPRRTETALEIAAQLAASLGARIGVEQRARGSCITLHIPAQAEGTP